MAESLAFREWAKQEGLVQTVPIKEFKGAVIGYDAEDFVNILLSTEGREPLLPALGGLPFTLKTHIDRELENIKKYTEKTPLFMFNGVDLALHDRKTISKESERAVRILDEAWRVYDNGDGDAAVRAFEKACKCLWRLYVKFAVLALSDTEQAHTAQHIYCGICTTTCTKRVQMSWSHPITPPRSLSIRTTTKAFQLATARHHCSPLASTR